MLAKGTHPATAPARPFSGGKLIAKRRERRFEAANSKAAVRQCAWQGPEPAGRRRSGAENRRRRSYSFEAPDWVSTYPSGEGRLAEACC
jgi:hypothetical protein